MNRIGTTILGLMLALGAGLTGLPQTAHAQEIEVTGPLAGQPAVRRMRQYRTEHVQLIVPTVGYTLQDEFSRSLMVGLEANFHFTDFLGIGVWGAMANFGNAFQIDTDLTSQVVANGQTTARNQLSMPSNEGFSDQVGRLLGLASAHIIFAPLRGKLALFQGAFVDTDFYVLLGFAAAFVAERQDVTGMAAQECNDNPVGTGSCPGTQRLGDARFAPAPMFGVGLNLYFNEFLGLALQWRGMPFDFNPSGTDEFGDDGFPDGVVDSQDQRFYFHHMMNIGLIITLPPEVGITE